MVVPLLNACIHTLRLNRSTRLGDFAAIEHNHAGKLLELAPHVAEPQVSDGKADARMGRIYLVGVRGVGERTEKQHGCNRGQCLFDLHSCFLFINVGVSNSRSLTG